MIAVEVSKHADSYDCDKCYHRYCDEAGDLPDSNGPAPNDRWEIPGVIKSRTCLLPMITDESRYYLNLHVHYRNNILPFSGGILEQPNIYMKAMEIIEAHSNG